ncbi:hypothetical protein CB1_001683034 [Camelus ferus]|nr:hypothetical protein CB1_001683034 [Camelus ferus]
MPVTAVYGKTQEPTPFLATGDTSSGPTGKKAQDKAKDKEGGTKDSDYDISPGTEAYLCEKQRCLLICSNSTTVEPRIYVEKSCSLILNV